MGHLGADNTSSVQSVQVNPWGIFTMVLWPQATPIVYEFQPFGDLKAFQIVNNQINSTILSQYSPPISSAYVGMALSANEAQNGILWFATGDLSVDGVPGTLHALDPTNLSKEFWNSDQASNGRDTLGGLAKFATPDHRQRPRLCSDVFKLSHHLRRARSQLLPGARPPSVPC